VVGRPWQEEQVLVVAAAIENSISAWRVPPLVLGA
jgi:Asp-tRNA(Asn)/Glu-tRNA(Gln) amidotransferase A subunit family amidase